MSVAAVIPIKTNNQRLPGKNTKILHDKPLLDYLFETVKHCELVDEIFVDSSDDYILELALKNKFTPIKRSVELNSPSTSGNDLLNFELQTIEHDIISQLFVTLPFLKAETIDRSIKTLIEFDESDSILALYEVYDRFWFDSGDGFLAPVNHDQNNLLGTQYMSPIYRESGFYTFRRDAFLREQKRVTNNFEEIIVSADECIDIDTEQDFIYAEAYAKHKEI